MEKIIGNYKVIIETILDSEGEIIYHIFNQWIFLVMRDTREDC
jgi:hypothetical protein